jgi:general secretion pathway protein I
LRAKTLSSRRLPDPGSAGPNGFTLLEVMVALAIFSLAALALMRLQAFSVRSGADVVAHDLAWQVARNRGAELLSDPAPPTLGSTAGTENFSGRNFRWTQNTQKTDDARIVRIDIIVEGDGGGRAILKLARPLQLL